MNNKLKTLTLITTGLVVGVVVGRVGKDDRSKNKLNAKDFSPINLDVSQLKASLSDATILATEALDKATEETKSYSIENHREIIRIVTNGKQATLTMQRPDEIIGRILLAD